MILRVQIYTYHSKKKRDETENIYYIYIDNIVF